MPPEIEFTLVRGPKSKKLVECEGGPEGVDSTLDDVGPPNVFVLEGWPKEVVGVGGCASS